MRSDNPVCIYCKEYREYCECERMQMGATLQDTYELEVEIEKLQKKVDEILIFLEKLGQL